MDKLATVLENIIYILSIAFQLSAAWLLVGNTSVTREKIIKEYCNSHRGVIAFDKQGELLNRSALEATIVATWTNRIAFIFLGMGYFLSVIGVCTIKRRYVVPIVVILTILFVAFPSKYAKKKSKEFKSPDLNEIPLKDGVNIAIVGDEQYSKDELLN